MTRHPLLASLLVLVSACVDNVSSDDDPGPDVGDSPPAGCTPEISPRVSVVACGFAPQLDVLDATLRDVFVVTKYGTYYTIDRATGRKTKLYRDTFGGDVENRPSRSVVHDGAIYIAGGMVVDGDIRYGLKKIDAVVPQEQPDVVYLTDQHIPSGRVIDHGERLYFGTRTRSSQLGPVVGINFDGTGETVLTPEWGQAMAIVDDFLYYFHEGDLRRVKIAIGPNSAETVAADVTFDLLSSRAVDDEFAYGAYDDVPYELVRWPVSGGTAQPIAMLPDSPDGDFPLLPPPTHLRRDDEWLYFLQSTQLMRIRADGSGEIEYVDAGSSPPVFDGDGLLVARERGGLDEPIEGVVLRVTLDQSMSSAAAGSSK